MSSKNASPKITRSDESEAMKQDNSNIENADKNAIKSSSVALDMPASSEISDISETSKETIPKSRQNGLYSFTKHIKRSLKSFFGPHSLVGYLLRLVLITIVIMIPGILISCLHPEINIQGIQMVHLFAYIAYFIVGYYYIHFICRCIVYWMKGEYFRNEEAQFLHIFYTIKKPFSLALYIIVWIILWNATSIWSLSIWDKHYDSVNRILSSLAIGASIYAIKKCMIKNIAVKFNYTNYMPRIQDCLFIDRMLADLIDKGSELWETNRETHNHSEDKYGICLFEDWKNEQHMISEHADSSNLHSQLESMVSISSIRSESPAMSGNDKRKSLKLLTFNSKEKEQIGQLSSSANRQSTKTVEKERLDPFALAHSLTLFRKLEKRIHNRFGSLENESETSGFKSVELYAKTLGQCIVRWLATKNSIVLPSHDQVDKKHSKKVHITKPLPSGIRPIIRIGKNNFAKVISNQLDLDRLWKMLTIMKKQTQVNDKEQNDRKTTGIGPIMFGELDQDSEIYDNMTIRDKHISSFINRYITEVIMTAKGLGSMEYVIGKLDILFTMGALFVFFMIISQIFTSAATIMATITTGLAGISFMLSSSARNVFESAAYICAIHPYDIGDRVYISLTPTAGPTGGIVLPAGGTLLTAAPGSGTLDNLLVTHVELLSTTFERWDGAKVIVPNYILATKPLINVRRSGALYEVHNLQIAFDTDHKLFEQFKSDIREYLSLESKDYNPNYLLLTFDRIENVNRLQLALTVQHRTNWQDWEEQITRRSKFTLFIKECLTKLGITYSYPIQPVEMISGNKLNH